jgi:hydroxyethylthiazole kinase-like uncharacterized protein yjeF
MRVVDSAGMAEIDRRAQALFGLSPMLLMEDAGLGAYRLLLQHAWRGSLPAGRIVFLVGKGNNGGDALVMARRCRLEGKRDLCIVLGAGSPPGGSLAEAHLRICTALGLEVIDFAGSRAVASRRIREAAWLVDGLLGTGLAGAARSPLAELIALANRSAARRVAVDIPSGIGDSFRAGYPAFQAEWTLTVALPKLCLYLPAARPLCGRVLVVPAVFPEELLDAPGIPGEIITPDMRERLLRPVPPESHKGTRGHLAVFAGGYGTTGAAWLCANAAARSRVGLVTVYADEELYPALVPKFTSVMVRPWARGSEPALDRYSGLLVGPGWGTGEQRRAALRWLLGQKLPGVLDADGVTLLAGMRRDGALSLRGRWVLTPHPGEFARLSGVPARELLADPLPRLLSASAELEAVIVLKGHCTLVAAPDGSYWILDGMNPAMATAGAGDVLSGIIGGVVAAGYPAAEAARLGVLLHHLVGKTLYREQGFFIAEDMVPRISQAVAGGAGAETGDG